MTMAVLRTFGHITTLSKGNQVDVEFGGDTVQDFLDEIVKRYGEGMRNILYPNGKEFSNLIYVLVNGRNIKTLEGMGTKVKDGDKISVLPVTAGG
jgi:molybdopterin synthase sulfur carrier subunit